MHQRRREVALLDVGVQVFALATAMGAAAAAESLMKSRLFIVTLSW
jgi:hypothetical protein